MLGLRGNVLAYGFHMTLANAEGGITVLPREMLAETIVFVQPFGTIGFCYTHGLG